MAVTITNTTTTTLAGLTSGINNAINANWGAYTKTTPAGNYLAAQVTASAANVLTITATALGGAAKLFYLYHGWAGSTGAVNYLVSVSESHLYIRVEGPGPGAAGANNSTTGSPAASFALCEFTAFDAADSGDKVVAFGDTANSATSDTENVWIAVARGGAANGIWLAAEAMSPARVGETVGAQPAVSRNTLGTVAYPFDVIDPVSGIRGRVQRMYLAQRSRTVANYTYEGRHYVDSGGVKYQAVGAVKRNSSNTYTSSWGTPEVSAATAIGLPIILIPEV